MKGNAVFKRSFNGSLELCSKMPLGAALPSENELSQALSVSRTTVRSVLKGLEVAGIVTRGDGVRHVARHPNETDHFPDPQTMSQSATVERRFLEWVLEGHIGAGHLLTASELARQFNTSTTIIREHLPHFQHFGLIERRPNSAWLFKGITPAFANEIYDVREMFELRAARSFIALSDSSEPWRRLLAIEREHWKLKENLEASFARFPDLDEQLHRTIHEASDNRFVMDFYDISSMLFHYNFRWNASNELQRTSTAVNEHLDYIDALKKRNTKSIEAACRRHLRTARSNLLRSIELRETKTDGKTVSQSFNHSKATIG